ncbi:MAG: GatB/YqeY domain-containing protein [Dehalococcoidia bacterium]|nr:GatB/YqeY domain-containing protein [Dehalococcoidia bacterium]
MTCEGKIREDLKEALKQRNQTRASVLRMLLSEIKNTEIAQQKHLDDDKILDVISKEVKRHRESIEAFRQGNRSDLVVQEKAELSILMGYLPKQMSREEIRAAARRIIETVGVKGKGSVMAQLMPQLRGKADGKEVSEIVSELLSAA